MEPYLPVNRLIRSKRTRGELRRGLRGMTQYSPRNARICHSRFKFIKTLKSYRIKSTSVFQMVGPTFDRGGGAGGQSSHCRCSSIRVVYENTGCLHAFGAVHSGGDDMRRAAVFWFCSGYAAATLATAKVTYLRATDTVVPILYPVKTVGAVGWSHICQLTG